MIKRKTPTSKTVAIYAWLFGQLTKVSVFNILRIVLPEYAKNHLFVEFWVTLNLIASIAFVVANDAYRIPVIVEASGMFYGCLRIWEIIIYQINVLLFDQFRKERNGEQYKLRGFRRLVLLSLQNYAEILFWFASLYFLFASLFSDPSILSTLTGSLYYSLVTMSTLGYGDITPVQQGGFVLVIAHSVVGLFMTLMIIARFISLLPIPDSLDDFK